MSQEHGTNARIRPNPFFSVCYLSSFISLVVYRFFRKYYFVSDTSNLIISFALYLVFVTLSFSLFRTISPSLKYVSDNIYEFVLGYIMRTCAYISNAFKKIAKLN